MRAPSLAATTLLRVLHLDADAAYSGLVTESLSRQFAGEVEVTRAARLDIVENIVRNGQSIDALLIDPVLFNDMRESAPLFSDCLADIPMVCLGADESHAERMIDQGAQDYLTKGRADSAAMMRALRFAVERTRGVAAQPLPRLWSAAPKVRLLLVEDNLGDACLLEDCLSHGWTKPCQVITVDRLSTALARLDLEQFDAAVVDLALPDSRGLETCLALREHASELPFVVHTGSDDTALAIKSVRNGASDFLVKRVNSGSGVARAIRFAMGRQEAAARRGKREVSQANAAKSTQFLAAASEFGGQEPVLVVERTPRYPVVRSMIAIPVAPGGKPDWQNRRVGITNELGYDGLSLELDAPIGSCQNLMVGVERRDGVLCYAGLQVLDVVSASTRSFRVNGEFGGLAQEILDSAVSPPQFQSESFTLGRTIAASVLTEWQAVEVLSPLLLDSVQVCPRCQALPTFRPGCASCGSGRVTQEKLIHHFKCANVAPIRQFEGAIGLHCPKCRARNLIVGADFEYQQGSTRCEDCHWRGVAPEGVGQCLRCAYRFPGKASALLELTGYHVQRLDPLAFIEAS